MTCPVCNATWPPAVPSCMCGYEFTTRDPGRAIERLARDARRGNGIWRRGLIALVCLPITFNIGAVATGVMLGTAQLVLSAIWIVQGLVVADRANKKLASAKALLQLPAARVVR